ncbi:MAG: hypothetical protein SP1CHLAM54_12270 [Chlamydiia bacterium]|nr:hypothetical protein [Chlamydiia bacterium]MCH9616125.1 hypothetical protein [Chlamydiia bacterium]MCH9629452.1 hypothetical protein [Chlamydiia bacterium]
MARPNHCSITPGFFVAFELDFLLKNTKEYKNHGFSSAIKI